MPRTAIKPTPLPHTGSKLHRYLKKSLRVNVSLKDVQKSLSGIGISLSKRVIEDREKR